MAYVAKYCLLEALSKKKMDNIHGTFRFLHKHAGPKRKKVK